MTRLLMLVLLICPIARSQLLLSGGTSNLFSASGGSVSWFNSKFGLDVGAGEAGQFVYGADIHFQVRGCTMFIGDRVQSFSTSGAGLSVSARGVTYECRKKNSTYSVFTGATGEIRSTPFFQAMTVSHFGSGVSYSRKFDLKPKRYPGYVRTNFLNKFRQGTVELSGAVVKNGNGTAVVQGARYHNGRFTADESSGIVLRQRYFEGDGTYSGQHFSVNLTHSDYFQQNVPGHIGANGEGLTSGVEKLSFFGSAFQSPTFSGEAAGTNTNPFRWLSATAMGLFTKGNKQFDLSLSERAGRFSVSEFVAQHSTSLGGSYTGNLISFGVSYGMVYSPYGFEKIMSVSIRLQLSRGSLNGSVNILPGSRILYSGYAGAWVGGPGLGSADTSHMAE